MKKTKQILVAMCLLVGMQVQAQMETEYIVIDGIRYGFTTYNGILSTSISVHPGEPAYTGDIVVPSSVNYNGKTYKVSIVQSGAFSRCRELTSVELPNSITKIQQSSFLGCVNLKSIKIPNSVTEIGKNAFQECISLTSIDFLPKSITKIGDYAFYGCINLETFKIPNNLTSLGVGNFSYCTSLKSIDVPKSLAGFANIVGVGTTAGDHGLIDCVNLTTINVEDGHPSLFSHEGVLYSNFGEGTLVFYPRGKTADYIMQSNVATISGGAYRPKAFADSKGLTSLVISEGVKTIDGTFHNCSNLTSVVIPSTVEKMNNPGMFQGCSSLHSIIWLRPNPDVEARISTNYFLSGMTKGIHTLYIPAGSKENFLNWESNGYFKDIIELTGSTPTNNSAEIQWERCEYAKGGYRIVIYTDETRTVEKRILEFDVFGILRNDTPLRVASAETTFTHTITSLDSNTKYFYSLEYLGEGGAVLFSTDADFTTLNGATAINEISDTTGQTQIVGYYSLTGQQLNEEPESGVYIVMFDNGSSEKRMKK